MLAFVADEKLKADLSSPVGPPSPLSGQEEQPKRQDTAVAPVPG